MDNPGCGETPPPHTQTPLAGPQPPPNPSPTNSCSDCGKPRLQLALQQLNEAMLIAPPKWRVHPRKPGSRRWG